MVSTQLILRILLILACIIFIGLCIEAGGYLTNAVFALVKPEAVKYLWKEVDLSALLRYDRSHFFTVVVVITIISVLKAVLFYLIIRVLFNKNLSLAQPFNQPLVRFINTASFITLLIGIFCTSGMNYSHWLKNNGASLPDVNQLHFDGGDVWLFMAVTLFIIAQVFKKGIEIQTENELTV
ncbi:DUF2975 domain-containing protein [Terrimonas sp. NA20]|uniref:DUF2975 domain-containing protein n=1 Tax=Terrimonas ginsenosidimutans TaxID=2908004 RepID=A0ABS9KQQ4_9BACT|nr:DUF2975 domain-containing protein [Terrimonas ginsenosidimutans]MCG2614649.1 DUF2975 domain-containing protein [Terrimonas ginsenosidimutans]